MFCSVEGSYPEYDHLNPLACFMESEDLSLILPVKMAEQAQSADQRYPLEVPFKSV